MKTDAEMWSEFATIAVICGTVIILAWMYLMLASARTQRILRRLRELYDPKRVKGITGHSGYYTSEPEELRQIIDYVEDRTARTREILGIDTPVSKREGEK